METLLQQIASALLAQNRAVATAESCTGGLLGAALTDMPGSSAWYLGGVVAYDNSLKIRLLGVSPEILASRGAVSAETARAMAQGIQTVSDADFTVSVTGIAGPGGGTPDKPVGLVYIAVAGPAGITVFEHRFAGTRAEIRAAATDAALRHLLDALLGAAPPIP